jgi:hypothetical protein
MKTNTLSLLHSALHAKHKARHETPKELRPRAKRRTYSYADALKVIEELRVYLHAFPGQKGVQRFLKAKKMDKRTLRRMYKRVLDYNENPPKHGQKGKVKNSSSLGSGRKATVISPEMGD